MAIIKRPAASRGRTDLDWLTSRHTFSFGEYRDPSHMGFRALRVLNDDIVEPGQGFGQHGHRDAEIVTYVMEGSLEHRDSMGNGRIITAGELQYMSAGRGVLHSEFNASLEQFVHFLQIWLLPDVGGGEPRYEETRLDAYAAPEGLALLFSGSSRDGAITIKTDADVYFGRILADGSVLHRLGPSRGAWIHVTRGAITTLGEHLGPGDGAAIEHVNAISIETPVGAEFFLFDMR